MSNTVPSPNAPHYPSNFVNGVAPADVIDIQGHHDDNALAGRVYKDMVGPGPTIASTPFPALYPTDGGNGVTLGTGAIPNPSGTPADPVTDVIVDLNATLATLALRVDTLNAAITALNALPVGTPAAAASAAAKKSDFAEGRLGQINWLRHNALHMTHEINQMLGSFDVLGLYSVSHGAVDASGFANTNVVSRVPPFIVTLAIAAPSPYPTDFNDKYPHTAN